MSVTVTTPACGGDRLRHTMHLLAAVARQLVDRTQWKVGNEMLPFHPQASQVHPEYRDGWNACYYALLGFADAASADAPAPEVAEARVAAAMAEMFRMAPGEAWERVIARMLASADQTPAAAAPEPDGMESRAGFHAMDARLTAYTLTPWQVWHEAVRWASGASDN